MIDNNHELTIGELDAVSGGMLEGLLVNIVKNVQKAQGGGSGEPGAGGGQKDPLAQMFQQLLQQNHG
jgi:hypothetical protein